MFKPGQKIVCIDDTPKDNRPETIFTLSKIKEGEIYVVREILSSNGAAISLEGIISPYSEKLKREIGYKSDRFRPLDTHGWVEELLAGVKEEIEDELLIRLPG